MKKNQFTQKVLQIKFKKLDKEARIPTKGSEYAAGFDLFTLDEGTVRSNSVCIFDTGIAIELPPNYVALVCTRSGLAFKQGIQVANTPGVIDADYRDSIKIALVIHKDEMFHIKKGDRIAQLIIISYPEIVFEEVQELSNTKRGLSGIGSTGLTAQELMAQL